jgi:hypothetical protein
MVIKNLPEIDEEKLKSLADTVYLRGGIDIMQIVRAAEAGRPIRI